MGSRTGRGLLLWALALVLFEVVLTYVIILKVPYTEIDWVAYMQEVAGVLGGERNYDQLKGDTGPLVYPAGFVYTYAALHWFTGAQVANDGTYEGSDVRKAQLVFGVLYVATAALALAIYLKAAPKVPPLALSLLCASKRVHSIFVLRLFNDGVASLLAYAAVLLFAHRRWPLGCFVYSLAVSVKMNVLLFAPGLLLLLLQAHVSLLEVAGCLAICAIVQIVLALPFLLTHPVVYLRGAFDLGRVFMVHYTNLQVLVSARVRIYVVMLFASLFGFSSDCLPPRCCGCFALPRQISTSGL
jgi:alpha-1,3-mannosyltransferase